ncbi:AraC family transcriptional regulator [Vibrio paucivorans]
MKLQQAMQRYADTAGLNELEGVCETQLPGVWFYRSSQGNKRQPFVYQSGIIILGQGKKHIHMGDNAVKYGEGDYLVVGVPMPLECEAFPEEDKPLLGISIDIPATLLHKLVNSLEKMSVECTPIKEHKTCGLESVSMDETMLDCCTRLVNALCDRAETEILGHSIIEELVYRALRSPKGHILFELAHQEGQYARIAKALSKVHSNYDEVLTVQSLAEEASMSVSAFHSAFRAVTLESPLQYIKKVRLTRAKELIHGEGRRVSDAARMVGYSSSSQFSREYKRHFNETPKGMKAS